MSTRHSNAIPVAAGTDPATQAETAARFAEKDGNN
jgi:hypothetical protein